MKPCSSMEETSGGKLFMRTAFLKMLALERKRTERSQRPFVLMLLDFPGVVREGDPERMFEPVLTAVSVATRETDLKGWYEDGLIIGIIYTEIGPGPGQVVASGLASKMKNALHGTLNADQADAIRVTTHVYPDDTDG